MSPLLFNIVIKALAIAICTSPMIGGTQTSPLEYKIELYADVRAFVFFF